MTSFPDTSFLCAIYRSQTNSREASAHFKAMQEALHVSPLSVYEFQQSARYQVWLNSKDRSKGYSQANCDRMLADLKSDFETGAVLLAQPDWSEVLQIAERLSKTYTVASGHRSFDILHVATALHLGASEFLTFDANQRKLATAEKIVPKP